MSDYDEDGAKPKFPTLAFLFGIAWAAGLGALYYFYRPGEEREVSELWAFMGRFHPLIVHLPIGLILIVPLLELIGRWSGHEHARAAVPAILWLAVLGAAAATVLGYLLMTAEPDESVLMERHFWSGLIFGGLALVTLLLRLRGEGFLYLVTMLLSVASVSVAGHFGGALVHGSGYLAKYAPEQIKPYLSIGFGESLLAVIPTEEPGTEPEAEETPEEVPLVDRVVFTDFVLPIMESKCNECHNEEKTKGKLRLDTHEWIMAGTEGADYANVEPGNSEESELIYRVTLPSDDDDVMPPDGKDPLTPEELTVVRWWIDGGASAEATVAELEADDGLSAMLLAIDAALEGDEEAAAAIAESAGPISEWDLLSPDEQRERTDEVLAAADHFNFSVMPISAEDDRLKVNVVNAAKEFSDEQLASLEPVAERVLWLDLGRSQVTDAGMKSVSRMRNLERLHLENTKVSDAGIAQLGGLTKLEYLNLYGTEVTAAIFEPLGKVRNLRKLYLWQTKVDPADARAFQRSMSLEVNIGTELAASVPEEPVAEKPAAEAEAPKPEAKPKPAEPKKDAPAPAKAEEKSKSKANPQPKPATPKPAAEKTAAKGKGKGKGKAAAPTPEKKADAPKPTPETAKPKADQPPKDKPKAAAKAEQASRLIGR